jgi:hypothetical protein
LADFAKLLGIDAEPRFDSIKRTGSFSLKARVPRDKEIDVKTRGFLLRTGDAPEDAILARDRIARRLGVHRAKSATLLDSQQSKVVEIPVIRPLPNVPNVPSLTRASTLQGKIVRIGGRQDTVSVELQDVDGQIYLCKASREVAKKLAREMFDSTIRVHGHGRWTRDGDGIWRVDEFHISSEFEILEDDSLVDVLKDLRSIKSGWKDLDDPGAEMELIRSGAPHRP